MNPLRSCLHRIPAAACCLAMVSACGGGSGPPEPRVALPSTEAPTGPQPPPAEFVLRGEVFSFDHGMLASADVGIFVTTGNMGYSYWWANGRLTTDALGQFEAELPRSVVDIYAAKSGFVQPCGIRFGVSEDNPPEYPARVELQHTSQFSADVSPLPQTATEPTVTGNVYAETPNGVESIAGATLWAEHPLGIVYATTLSNLNGGYYLCRLPPDSVITVVKEGYKLQSVGPLDWSQPVQFDFRLEAE